MFVGGVVNSWMKKIYYFFVVMAICSVASSVSAQQGAEIFKNSACSLLGEVLTKDFGSLLTILAGVFAIFSAIVGSFRNAWILVFVSVGIYIFPGIVEKFFPSLSCG